MKFSKGTTTVAAMALAVGAVLSAPIAGAETGATTTLGQQAQLVNGDLIQGWTISGLKPSSDPIPYAVRGTLWEATATDKAIAGDVIPIVSNLNARARNGDTYRVLFGVATPQGINPSALTQGESTTGKIYFDVVGENPDSVFYSSGDDEIALWLTPPPAPATGSSSGAAAASEQTPAAPAVAPGSQGTPLATGSQGTPLPAGSQGTPLPATGATTPAPAATDATAPEAASTPAASEGTPATAAAPTTAAAAPTTAGVPHGPAA